MKRTIFAVLAASLTVAALPVVVNAHHNPGHSGGGGGVGGVELTITTSPNPTVFQRATVIAGRLKGPDNANKTVTLREDAYPYGADAVAATAQTDGTGAYRFTRSPSKNTRYRVTRGAVASPRVLVLVRARVSLFVNDRTPLVGQIVRFSGRACPTHDGLGVGLQRKRSTGGFRTIRSTTLKPATRCSVYSRRVKVTRDGTFRVITAGHPDHARGISRTVFLNVHR